MPDQQPQPLYQVRDRVRVRPFSIRTEQDCVDWIYRFIISIGKRQVKAMGTAKGAGLAFF